MNASDFLVVLPEVLLSLYAMLALVVVLVRHYAFGLNEGGAIARTEGVREG